VNNLYTTRSIANHSQSGLHPQVFAQFPRWKGTVPEGFIVNFLGVLTRATYFEPYADEARSYPPDRYVKTEYPPLEEEYFEWLDLLESITAANGHFTMVELGAGYGRWTANAAVAAKHLGDLPYTLVAVEAEPTHFQWMVQHLADNSVDPNSVRLVQAAVARATGTVGFAVGQTPFGEPHNWYGQSIGGSHLVNAVDLNTLLEPLQTVDLVDLDIQGAELEVLDAASLALDQKVKRVHIGTHGPLLEEGLHSLFARLGWRCVRSFPCAGTVETELGRVRFGDGVQTWVNPTFCANSVGDAATLIEKLESSRREGARLWAELEAGREQRERARRIEQSLGWKMVQRIRGVRGRIAPVGSRRRKIFDFFAERL
jgi:FkbM family methyltransferase